MRSQAHLKDTFSLGLNFMEEAGRSPLWALGDACPGCTKELGGQPWLPEKNRWWKDLSPCLLIAAGVLSWCVGVQLGDY